MSAQDRLEKVLRDMHVLISKSESYSGDRIIVNKAEIFALIDRLNASIYEIMDEYELTKQSRDRAERESKRKADKVIWDAQRQAEDIYAASVLYTDEALNHLQTIMESASDEIIGVQQRMLDDLESKKKVIKENQLELKGQLQDLVDTSKYLMIIEERNKEIQKEKDLYRTKFGGQREKDQFADVKTEIKINKEYFIEHGLEIEEETPEDEAKDTSQEKVASEAQGEGADAEPVTPFSEEELARMSEELDKEFLETESDENKPRKGKKFFGKKA